MPEDKVYIKLGIFIVCGLFLCVTAVIILGSGVLFKNTISAETYFNESVQGLDVGAPVKYRGVQIGNVSEITFPTSEYTIEDIGAEYVMVMMELEKGIINTFFKDQDIQKEVGEIIAEGLRVRLTVQGLTGVSFLEMDYFDPERNQVLPISWVPKSLFIPSAPSTFSRIEEALNTAASGLDALREIDLSQLTDNVTGILEKINTSLESAQVDQISDLLVKNLDSLSKVVMSVEGMLAAEGAQTIMPNMVQSAQSLAKILEESDDDIVRTIDNFEATTANLAETSEKVNALLASPDMVQGMESLANGLKDIDLIAAGLKRSVTALSEMSEGNKEDIRSIVEESKMLMENLNLLIRGLEANPAVLLFGSPPQPIDLEKLP
jgi:paraquat-inducible protein B